MNTPTIGTVPALVAVFQPAFGIWRVFMTGGQRDCTRWMHGDWQGWRTMGDLPHGSVRLSRGVYGLPLERTP